MPLGAVMMSTLATMEGTGCAKSGGKVSNGCKGWGIHRGNAGSTVHQ